MPGTEPDDRPSPGKARPRRHLERAPSERYAAPGSTTSDGAPEAAAASGSALTGPLVLALLVSAAGAGALVLLGAILASTLGLLFLSGAIGTATGLILAGAAAPSEGLRPVTRRTVTVLALVMTLGAIVVAFVVTWLYARSEGGTLDLLDYLVAAFGPFVPGELIIGAVTAAWGANAGPVRR